MAHWISTLPEAVPDEESYTQLRHIVHKEHQILREENSASLREILARIEELFLRQREHLELVIARQLKANACAPSAKVAVEPFTDRNSDASDLDVEELPDSNKTAWAADFTKFTRKSDSCPCDPPEMCPYPVPPEAFTPVLPDVRRRSSRESYDTMDTKNPVSRLDTAQEMDEHAAVWNNHLKNVVATQLAASRSRSKSFYAGFPDAAQTKSFLHTMVDSIYFNVTCAIVILANTAFVGFHADWDMKSALSDPIAASPGWFASVHLAFLIAMVLELLVRVVAWRMNFILGHDQRWNVFDMILILLSVIDEAFLDSDVHIFRVLRMVRLLRVVRSVRLFRDLRFMVACIKQSLIPFGWALVLLLSIMVIFSILFMQAVTLHLQRTGFSPDMRKAVSIYYPSLFDTLMSLLQCITSGVDWHEVSRPLSEISFVYRLCFAFYILFVVVGVLNVLTGLFVERACELSGLDRDLVVQSRMNREDAFLCEMKDIFEEVDVDGSGKISWEEFREYLKKDEVRAYLATQQLDAYDARQLFNILHIGSDEEVGIEEFILGLTRVKGVAKSVDVVALLQETRQVSRKMRSFMTDMQEQVQMLASFVPVNMRGNKAGLKHSASSVTSSSSGRKKIKDMEKPGRGAGNMMPVELPSTPVEEGEEEE